MTKVKFLHKPGYIYDLLTLFVFYFNKEHWNSYYVNPANSQDDLKYIKEIIDDFSYTPDELSLFFSSDAEKGSFLINKYFLCYKDELINKMDLDFLVSEISDVKEFSQRLLDFFFPDSCVKANYRERSFFTILSTLIKESKYSDNVKNKLILFFIEPEKYIDVLKKELMNKNGFLSDIYKNKYKILAETQDNFDYEHLSNQLKSVNKMSIDYTKYDEVYISICLVNRIVISGFLFENSCLQIIGYNYLESLKTVLLNEFKFDIEVFGKIVSDKNRLEVIRMLSENMELTTSEIAIKLGTSVNAAYYHLDMMNQAVMIKSRNEGRTVFYKLNKEYFIKASDYIKNIGEK